MTQERICPCQDCLCVPACKNKHYGLLLDCNNVFNYLYYGDPTTHQDDLAAVAYYLGKDPVFIRTGNGMGEYQVVISQASTFGDSNDR